jgi:hypothetical protein
VTVGPGEAHDPSGCEARSGGLVGAHADAPVEAVRRNDLTHGDDVGPRASALR